MLNRFLAFFMPFLHVSQPMSSPWHVVTGAEHHCKPSSKLLTSASVASPAKMRRAATLLKPYLKGSTKGETKL